MIDARALAVKMEDALIARAEEGHAFWHASIAEQGRINALARRRSGPEPERTRPRPSSLANLCARADAHMLLGHDRLPMSAASAAAVQQGSDLELGILDDCLHGLALLGVEFSAPKLQGRVETEHYVGTFDMLLALDDMVILFDAKTANCDSFEIKKREGMSKEHRTQLSLYAVAAGATHVATLLRNTDPRAKRGRPSAGVYHVQVEPVDLEAVAQAKRVASAAMAAREAGDVNLAPTLDQPPGYWLCERFCNYRHLCPRGGKG